MSLLSGTNLAKAYGPQDVFADVSVAIPRGGRIALVGPNGAGKTTLLRILAGEEEPSAGRTTRARGIRIGYLPQEALPDEGPPVGGTLWEEMLDAFAHLRAREAELRRLEALLADLSGTDDRLAKYGALQAAFERDGGYTYEARIRQVLGGLGFDPDDFARPVGLLSGGQKTRARLARLLLEAPDLLILDEPTNHLDMQAVEWLEAGRLETYAGNYSDYVTQRAERRQRQAVEYSAQQAFIARQSDYIRRNIAGQNSRQAKGRLRRLERLTHGPKGRRSAQGLKERPREAKTIRVNLRAPVRSGDRVLETHGLVVGYADEAQPLFRAPDLLLWRAECAAVIGPNGAGKTTFLRTLLGQTPPLAGSVRLGASLHIGYFSEGRGARSQTVRPHG